MSSSGKGEDGEASVVVSGKGKMIKRRSCAVEYPIPCVRRLRERRLIAYLCEQGFYNTFKSLIHETAVYFSVLHMRRLVKEGLWEDALMYLNSCLPAHNRPRSLRARIFHNFLLMHYRFANVVAGNKDKHLDMNYGSHARSSSHADLRLRSIIYSILASDQIRASLDWEQVREHASFLILRLVRLTPELRYSTSLPPGRMMSHDVLPIGSGLCRGRRHVKKQGPQPRKTVAILCALRSKGYLNQPRDAGVGSLDESKEILADFLDESLQAGVRRGCRLSYSLQPTGNEGAPSSQTMLGDPISQAMVGSFTDPAKHSEIFSVKSAGSPVCKTISCIWTDHAKNPGFSSPTNAGTNEHLKEVGSTKNPRDGLTTVEEDFYAKKQRTTGAFGEASSVPAFGNQKSTGTVVKNFSPKLSRVCSV